MGMSALKVVQFGIRYYEISSWRSLDIGWITNCMSFCEQGNRQDFSRSCQVIFFENESLIKRLPRDRSKEFFYPYCPYPSLSTPYYSPFIQPTLKLKIHIVQISTFAASTINPLSIRINFKSLVPYL